MKKLGCIAITVSLLIVLSGSVVASSTTTTTQESRDQGNTVFVCSTIRRGDSTDKLTYALIEQWVKRDGGTSQRYWREKTNYNGFYDFAMENGFDVIFKLEYQSIFTWKTQKNDYPAYSTLPWQTHYLTH